MSRRTILNTLSMTSLLAAGCLSLLSACAQTPTNNANASGAPAPMPKPQTANLTTSESIVAAPADMDVMDTTPAKPRRNSSVLGSLNLYGQLPATGPGATTANSSLFAPAATIDSPDNLRRITYAIEGDDFDPQVSPDGQWLVYASTQHRPTADIYIKRIGANTMTQLTNDPADDAMPTFSPDGKKIAFASNRSGNWDIYLMDVGGGQAIQLTNDASHDLHPSFSPDGKNLVYCSFGGPSSQWELVVISIENPAVKHYIGGGLMPSWSPVDNRIVFQRARSRGTRWFSIWTLDYTNGEGQHPTEIAASSNAACITPQWSPDGKYVVFSTVINPGTVSAAPSPAGSPMDRPTSADLWISGIDGNNRFRLTNGQFANLQPTWSHDGSVYFVSNRAKDGAQNIWGLKVEQAILLAQSAFTTGRALAEKPATAPVPGVSSPTENATASIAPASQPLANPVTPTTATPAVAAAPAVSNPVNQTAAAVAPSSPVAAVASPIDEPGDGHVPAARSAAVPTH